MQNIDICLRIYFRENEFSKSPSFAIFGEQFLTRKSVHQWVITDAKLSKVVTESLPISLYGAGLMTLMNFNTLYVNNRYTK